MINPASDYALEAFLKADPEEKRRMLEVVPDLLSEASAAYLEGVAAAHENEQASVLINVQAALIRDCLSKGISAVFDEIDRNSNAQEAPVSEHDFQKKIQRIIEIELVGIFNTSSAVTEELIELCDAVLPQIDRQVNGEGWASIQYSKAKALLKTGRETEDANHLRKAIMSFDAALELIMREGSKSLWADIQHNRSSTLQSIWIFTQDLHALRDALVGYESVLEVWTKESDPASWATTQQSRGNVLHSLGNECREPHLIREALAAYNAALEIPSSVANPDNRMMAHRQRAEVCLSLWNIDEDPSVLKMAIGDFDMVIQATSRERVPVEWAALVNLKAKSILVLGEHLDNAALLREAITLSDDSLEALAGKFEPMESALGQIIRGGANRVLGKLAQNMEILRNAASDYESALEVVDREGTVQEWVRAMAGLASVYEAIGQLSGRADYLKKSLSCYDGLLSVRTKEKYPNEWVLIKRERGATLSLFGKLTGSSDLLREAVDCAEEALEVQSRVSDPLDWASTKKIIATALMHLGIHKDDMQILRESVECFNSVLEIYTRNESPTLWASTLQNKAIALDSIGDLSGDPDFLQQAVSDYRRALKVRTLFDEPFDFAQTQMNMGGSLSSLGRLAGDPSYFRTALECYDAALEVWSRETSPGIWAMIRHNQANALLTLGRLTEDASALTSAVAGCDAALEIRTRAANPSSWAMTQQNRALALLSLGTFFKDAEFIQKAIAGLKAAFEIYAREKMASRQAINLQHQASALVVLSILESDPIILKEALEIFDAVIKSTSDDAAAAHRAMILFNGANAFQSFGKIPGEQDAVIRSLELFRSALDFLSMTSSPDQCMEVMASLIPLLVERGEFDEARSRLDEALEGGLGHLIRVENRAARERAIEQAAGLAELRAWIALTQDGDSGAALMWLERGRAQLLALSLAEDPEKAFAKELSELGDLLAAIPAEGAAVLPIIGPAGAQVAVVPGGRTGVTPEDFLDLPALTRARFQGWFFGPEDEPGLGGYLRAYRDGRLAWADRHAEPELFRLFPETLEATFAEVWEHLLGPVDARLREFGLAEGAPVTIMPPGLLGLLPLWAAAPEGGAPFGASWTVSLAPSLTALRAARKRSAAWEAAEAPVTILAVLDPTSDGQHRLPGAALEGGMLAQILGPDRVIALGGDAATEAAMTEAMPGRSHLHLSMHGFFSPTLPDQSALLLAGKDRLTLRALQELEAAEGLRLVVLSACDSGLPGMQRGRIDEFIGLPAGFLQAGAAAVIASHWPVRDDATFFLMWRFYREYLDAEGRERQSPAAALKAASLWLRDVTLGDLAALFEPSHDADGPVPFTIDRSRPRQTPEPQASLDQPATALPLEAKLRAAPSRRKHSGTEPKGLVDEALYDRIQQALDTNPAAYPLSAIGPDPAQHKPFNNPTLWAAFSATGV